MTLGIGAHADIKCYEMYTFVFSSTVTVMTGNVGYGRSTLGNVRQEYTSQYQVGILWTMSGMVGVHWAMSGMVGVHWAMSGRSTLSNVR